MSRLAIKSQYLIILLVLVIVVTLAFFAKILTSPNTLTLSVENLSEYNRTTFQIFSNNEGYFLVDMIANDIKYIDENLKIKDSALVQGQEYFFGVWNNDSHILIEKEASNYTFSTIKIESGKISKKQISIWDMTFWHEQVAMHDQMPSFYSRNEELLISNALKISKAEITELDSLSERFLLSKEQETKEHSQKYANMNYSYGTCYLNNFGLGLTFEDFHFRVLDCFKKDSILANLTIEKKFCGDRCDLLSFNDGIFYIILLDSEDKITGISTFNESERINAIGFNQTVISLSPDFNLQVFAGEDGLKISQIEGF
jgi:hypothetical protein